MSYLDIPRVHFAGRFFTDPSTMNNDPTHYQPEVTNPSPWQNAFGQHRFQLQDCVVTSVVGPDGFEPNDPVIGCAFVTTDSPELPPGKSNPAKMADLDVYQQGVPTIFGMRVSITVGTLSLTGTVDPITLNLLWTNCVLPTRSWQDGDYVQDSFGGDMNSCGSFQSIIRFDAGEWALNASPILDTLRQTTLFVNNQYLVSIKFIVDGYRNVPEDNMYLTGRIVGTLGPVFANEPLYNPGQRWLMPRTFSKSDPWYFPSFNNCPFKVDVKRSKLVLDLSNSICRQNAGGPPVDLGQLQAIVSTPDPVTVRFGAIDYSEFAYNNNAMITEVDLTPAQLGVLQSGYLSLVTSRTDIGNPGVLVELQNDVQFAVELRPIRMAGDPETIASTTVYVSQRGVPLPNKQLALFVESVHGDTPGATVPPTNPGDTPQADGALAATITASDQNGFATVHLKVLKDPGQRTPELDGQLYFIVVYDPELPTINWSDPKSPAPPQDQMISVVVFSQFIVDQNPGWETIELMLAPYMKLYPGMRKIMDPSNQHTFNIFAKNPPWAFVYNDNNPGPLGITAGAIPYYMSRPFNDPRYMPVTRDLSPAKVMTLMYFIKNLQSQPDPIA